MLSIEAAFRAACEAELAALKPGNVHVHADGHGMTVDDFRRSAQASAAPLCRDGATLGARILGAVTATRAAVGCNTNLGIVLLCAPIAMAAAEGGALRPALARVIAAADVADAEATFRAIALAAPAGLGSAPAHDVRAPATVPLETAMAEAAARDMIARQYATGYADIFDAGLPAYRAARRGGAAADAAVTALYLFWLARHPDSHVARKQGPARAAALQLAARSAGRSRSALLAWDSALKAEGINPGTSADLTVATVFAEAVETLAGVGR